MKEQKEEEEKEKKRKRGGGIKDNLSDSAWKAEIISLNQKHSELNFLEGNDFINEPSYLFPY